jgi:hypothetical protein
VSAARKRVREFYLRDPFLRLHLRSVDALRDACRSRCKPAP